MAALSFPTGIIHPNISSHPMKKASFFALATLALLSISYSASAQTATPGITARQHHEQARIRHGVRSGELTRTEAAHLEGREAEIRQDKREAKGPTAW